MVKLEMYGQLRELVGKREIELQIPNGSTLQYLLQRLNELVGKECEQIVSEYLEGSMFDKSLIVLVNGRAIDSLRGNSKLRISKEDTISLMSIASGG